MANTIRIKRRASGGGAGAPASLENAELAYNEQTDVLYYGKGTGGSGGSATTIEVVGGTGAMVTLGTAQTISGVKTFSASPLVPTPAAGDSTTKAASTAFITSQLGANNGIATLDGSGKLTASQVPAIAISDTFVVASQAAMLALTAEVGDIAIRTDTSETYILKASPASTLANWQILLSPATGGVTSVFGRTGAVTAASGDYTVGQVTGAAPLASPALTGTPTAPTAATATNTTQIATTAFVKAQGYSTTTGTVTSVAVSGGTTGLTTSGGPITTSGTITLAGTLAVANGGTGGTTQATARTGLGLGTMAVQNANAVAITGGTIDGVVLDGGTF